MHPRPTKLLALTSLVLLLGTGCNVFDESLIPSEQTGDSLGEDCIGSGIPTFESLNDFHKIDTSDLRNDRYELSCVGGSALGNDGFFAVDMQEGEKWHFHVKVTPGTAADATVYVLDSGCQDSVCQRGWGLNECVAGQDEHFSFVPERDGRYYVGVDTVEEGGEPMEVLAVNPVCGNGEKEHSETCEDSNTDSGDRCDASCRSELDGGEREVEPNDEPTANANVLMLEGGAAETGGQLGGKCDFDSFAFTVPDGGSVNAVITGGCSLDLRLQLVSPDGLRPLGTVDTSSGTCPEIVGTESFASDLDGGVYFVRLAPQRQDETSTIDYGLELQVTEP
jgi:cysteine-rich repeat protein